MNVLAIDTSGRSVSAAVLRSDGFHLSETVEQERVALQRLMPIVGSLLKESALVPADIGVVACTKGPGSFTGLRIGIAAAKAFAAAVGARVFGVSTLEMIAVQMHAAPGQLLAPVIDCCRGEIYCGLYRASGSDAVEQITDDRSIFVEEAMVWLTQAASSQGADAADILLCGPDATRHADSFPDMPQSGTDAGVDAGLLALLASRAPHEMLVPAREFQPEYLRLSQAEVRAEAD